MRFSRIGGKCCFSRSGSLYSILTACDLTVMPRSRSTFSLSRTCLFEPSLGMVFVRSSRRSASVDLPWSMCAMIEKLRVSNRSNGISCFFARTTSVVCTKRTPVGSGGLPTRTACARPRHAPRTAAMRGKTTARSRSTCLCLRRTLLDVLRVDGVYEYVRLVGRILVALVPIVTDCVSRRNVRA